MSWFSHFREMRGFVSSTSEACGPDDPKGDLLKLRVDARVNRVGSATENVDILSHRTPTLKICVYDDNKTTFKYVKVPL